MKRAIPLVLAVLSIAACASISHYRAPESGPMATVTIKTLDTEHFNIGVVSYRGSEYLESKGDVVTVLNSKAIGWPFTDHIVIKVVAGQPFRFSTKVGGNEGAGDNKIRGMVCITHSRFVPEAAVNYLVELDATRDNCSVSLSRLDSVGRKTPDPSLKKLKTCLDPWLNGSAFAADYCKEGFSYE